MSSPNLNSLEHLLGLDSSRPEFNDQVSNILHSEEYRKWVKRISSDDAVRIIDFLDRALDALDPASSGFRRCLRELRNICGTRMILPTPYTPPSQVLSIGRQPVASGGSGDVYEGTLNGSKVCVKRVRVYSLNGPDAAKKTLYQEAIVWKRLDHKNIVPLLAITTTPLQLISEWMPGGHLTEYIGSHPDANRLGLVHDIVEGLYYLHSRTIVHGDLKGPNILVNNSGRARITDFGLATVTVNLDSLRTASDEHGHTARWTAPEILNEKGSHSKEADVFSFAMVMIEVFTGTVPFGRSPPAAAIVAIMKGERPPRPTHPQFTRELWTLMQHCWNADPYSRPEVSEILRALGITPPSTNPYSNRIASSSTLTIGQQSLFAGLPRTAAQHSPSLHHTSSTSRPTPQVSSQWSGNNSPASPVNPTGGVGMDESQGPVSYVSPQATLERSSSSAHRRRSSQQRGKSSGNSNWMQSRQNTEASEVSPVLADPGASDPNELQQSRVDQLCGHGSGAGRSRPDLQSNFSDRNRSRRNVAGQGSRDGNDEGMYWSQGNQHTRGASRSALTLGDGHNRGSPSRNPSRPDLLTNASRDRLAQFNQSKPDLQNMGKSASRPDLVVTGVGPISRQPSKKDASKMSGYATRNPSRQEPPAPHECSETQEGQVDQADGHTGGVGKSRADIQNALGNRNRTKRGIDGNGCRDLGGVGPPSGGPPSGGPPSGGPPSGQPSKGESFGMNGYATEDASAQTQNSDSPPKKKFCCFCCF